MSTLLSRSKESSFQGKSGWPVFFKTRQSDTERTHTQLPMQWPGGSRGATTVEFAVTSSVFFLLMFMVIDFALFGFVNLTMQHAVREGARYAITGQVDLDPQAGGDRKRAVIQKIRDSSMGLFDEVMTETDIAVTDSDGVSVSNFGAPGQSIVITLNCQWPIINPFTQAMFANGQYNFSVGASMRNESFPGAGP